MTDVPNKPSSDHKPWLREALDKADGKIDGVIHRTDALKYLDKLDKSMIGQASIEQMDMVFNLGFIFSDKDAKIGNVFDTTAQKPQVYDAAHLSKDILEYIDKADIKLAKFNPDHKLAPEHHDAAKKPAPHHKKHHHR